MHDTKAELLPCMLSRFQALWVGDQGESVKKKKIGDEKSFFRYKVLTLIQLMSQKIKRTASASYIIHFFKSTPSKLETKCKTAVECFSFTFSWYSVPPA